MTTTPYLHYDQVFVILRLDPTASRERAPESGVGLLKALWSRAEAEAEELRLGRWPGRVRRYRRRFRS